MDRPRMFRFIGPLIAAVAGMSAAAAHAAEAPTLQRIAATATVRLGHREASVPFSYYADARRVVGYSHDIMLTVVEGLRSRLRLPALTIELVPVTSQNRIPLLVNGTVDLECGSTTHNIERERRVAFSNTIFIVGTRLLARRDAGIADFPDLAGKRVVVTAGTTAERLLRKYKEEHGIPMTILSAKDHDASFQQLEAGQASAFVMDDALLYGRRARASDPQQWIVGGTPLSSEAYACTMRRDDPDFKRLVDDAIAEIMTSGLALELYAKWFTRPVPPQEINLNWPISDRLIQLFAAPNDRPFE
ncbi:MAG: transporter substrate-binding domain-containing protein [Phreatobacter sp.]